MGYPNTSIQIEALSDVLFSLRLLLNFGEACVYSGGTSWNHLWVILEKHIECILGPTLGHFGPSCALPSRYLCYFATPHRLGDSSKFGQYEHDDTSYDAIFGSSWSHIIDGASLEESQVIYARMGSPLSYLGVTFGAPLARHLGPSLSHLRASWWSSFFPPLVVSYWPDLGATSAQLGQSFYNLRPS